MARPPMGRLAPDMPGALDQLDRILDAWYGRPAQSALTEGLWHPTVDIYNRDDDVVVELEVPGVGPDDVSISAENDHLIVEGSRRRSDEYKPEDEYYLERAFGDFHRIVHLPTSVDTDAAKAEFKDGLLLITLPKRKRAEGKKIEIRG